MLYLHAESGPRCISSLKTAVWTITVCLCMRSSSTSFQQVKRGVGGESGEVVVMPTKVPHLTEADVIVAAERGRN